MSTDMTEAEADLPAQVRASLIDQLRLFRTVVIALIVLALGLAAGYPIILPLKEYIPVYVEFSTSGNNFVTIKSAGQNVTERELLRDITLRSYVVMREGVDQVTEVNRYECVMSMSNSKVRNEFRKRYVDKPESRGDAMPLARVPGFKREIHIHHDLPIEARKSKGKHQVEFYTIDSMDGVQEDGVSPENKTEPETKSWVALIQYRYTNRKISIEKLKKAVGEDGAVCNPVGIEIVDYTLRPKN